MSVTHATRVREILDQFLTSPLSDLRGRDARERLRQLQSLLPQLQAFVGTMTTILDSQDSNMPVRSGRPPKVARAAKAPVTRVAKVRRGGRRSDGFSPTSFVLEAVQQSGRAGISPREIIAGVQAAAPGRHAQPANLVSPLLNRLKKRGLVTNRDGRWFATAG